VFVAAQAVRFAKQYAEQGLKERLPLIGIGVFTDESALRSMGDEAIGIVTSLIWAPTLPTPANQTFMKLAEAKGKNPPAYFTAVMYSAAAGSARRRTRSRASRRPRTLPGRDPPGERDHAGSARAHHARRVRQSHAERLHSEGRARGWKASEHRDPHLPDGVAVLDVQARGVPQVAGLRPQLPSGKTVRTMERRRHCMKRTTPVTPSTATVAPWGMRRVASAT